MVTYIQHSSERSPVVGNVHKNVIITGACQMLQNGFSKNRHLTLLYSRNWHNIIKQLYSNKFFFFKWHLWCVDVLWQIFPYSVVKDGQGYRQMWRKLWSHYEVNLPIQSKINLYQSQEDCLLMGHMVELEGETPVQSAVRQALKIIHLIYTQPLASVLPKCQWL